MTDFTDSIEATAESVEDLQQDLEAHLEDILAVDVDVRDPGVQVEKGDARLTVGVDLPGLEEELNERLEEIDSRFSARYPDWYLDIDLDGDPE